ncbi:MAG: PAS domain-containing protein [bacterium]|nr:PAS domain-containing protein [bacterium]
MPIANIAGLRWLEHCLDLLTLYDAAGQCVFSSLSMQLRTGFDADELQGNAISAYTHPDDANEVRDAFATAYASPGVATSIVMRHKRKDGTWLWFEGTVTNLLRDIDIGVVVCSYRDITGKRTVEHNLRNSERMMSAAERIAHFGCWEFDMLDPTSLEGNTLRWSDEVFRIFGYEPGAIEVTIENFFTSVHPDDREMVRAKSLEAYSSLSKISFEHRVVRPDGTIRWVQEEAAVDKSNVSGQMLRVTGTVQDITDRKFIERERIELVQRLTQRNSQLEQYAFIVSHDLRSPVSTMLGLVALIKDPDADDETRNTCLVGLMSTLHKLDETIQDLSTVVDDTIVLGEQRTIVRFQEIVQDVYTSLGINNREIDITTDFSVVSGMLSLRQYLYSIFQNLISNSVKYRRTDTLAQLHISSLRTGSSLMLSFRDNGLGLDLIDNTTDIFAKHVRVHKDIAGHGLGLYMVKSQVEALGGTIEVRSAVNKGTDFILEFPL